MSMLYSYPAYHTYSTLNAYNLVQLKNMINALHSSRENGTKAFHHKGSTFGWIDIYKMWMRECERREKGHARMVLKLRETHIIRDSWTKLNV